jgi:acyl-coenzyme A thioesterase PaaI-like protein
VRSSGRHRPAGMSASAAVQTTAERGTDVAALDMKIILLRPVHPDGQQLAATGTVLHGGAGSSSDGRGPSRRPARGVITGTTELTPGGT